MLSTGGHSASLLDMSTVKFASMVGNLGAPVGPHPDTWGDYHAEIPEHDPIVSENPLMTGLMMHAELEKYPS